VLRWPPVLRWPLSVLRWAGALLLVGCSVPRDETPAPAPVMPATVYLGPQADTGACDPRFITCWTSAQLRAVGRLQEATSRVRAGRGSRSDLDQLVRVLPGLVGKLDDLPLESLDRLPLTAAERQRLDALAATQPGAGTVRRALLEMYTARVGELGDSASPATLREALSVIELPITAPLQMAVYASFRGAAAAALMNAGGPRTAGRAGALAGRAAAVEEPLSGDVSAGDATATGQDATPHTASAVPSSQDSGTAASRVSGSATAARPAPDVADGSAPAAPEIAAPGSLPDRSVPDAAAPGSLPDRSVPDAAAPGSLPDRSVPDAAAPAGTAAPPDGGAVAEAAPPTPPAAGAPAENPEVFGNDPNDLLGATLISAMIWFLEVQGIIGPEVDYQKISAESFYEYDPDTDTWLPRGFTREERAEEVIASAAEDAFTWGFWISTLPMGSRLLGSMFGPQNAAIASAAGITASIGLEFWAMTAIQMKMALKVAAIYDWDIRYENREEIERLISMILLEELAIEAADMVVSNVLVPKLLGDMLTRIGGDEVLDVVVKNASTAGAREVTQVLDVNWRRAMAQGALRDGIPSSAWGQLAASAFVITQMAASGFFDHAATVYLGHHTVKPLAEKHLLQFFEESNTAYARQQVRSCAFRAAQVVLWADGQITELEKRLFQALMAKIYWADVRSPFFLRDEEVRTRSCALAEPPEDLDDGFEQVRQCSLQYFQFRHHRINYLKLLYALINVDSDASEREKALFAGLTAEYTSTRSSERRVEPVDIAIAERYIDVVLDPRIALRGFGDVDYRSFERLLPTETLLFLHDDAALQHETEACRDATYRTRRPDVCAVARRTLHVRQMTDEVLRAPATCDRAPVLGAAGGE
jgi:hypothetical protein